MSSLDRFESRAFRARRNASLIAYAVIIVVPILVVVFGSLKSQQGIFSNPLGPPTSPQTSNYSDVWKAGLPRAFRNSAIVTGSSVFCTVLFASLAGFAVARMRGWRANVLLGFFTLGLAIPAQVSIVQQFALFKDLGLTDSLFGLVVVETAVTLPVAVFILAGFMRTLPGELFEAAIVDGASNWRLYRSIVMPLSLPSVAAVTTFLFVIHWNDLQYPLLFLPTRDDLWTLPRQLVGLRGEYLTNYPVLFAGVLVASTPVVIAYVLLQRWFVAGMTSGAVKG